MTTSTTALSPIVTHALRRHFSLPLAVRAQELLSMGVPLGCFARAAKIMAALGATKANDGEWSLYAQGVNLELWHEKSGTFIEIAVLGGDSEEEVG